ncbi:hypothetical protein [Brachybacterium sp. GPGPB12]|uniref:hypothetical protein n=1 Tax=Brachybacterium sp. GPGPB12 TaxID=3023517 RepID=UPI0031342D6B
MSCVGAGDDPALGDPRPDLGLPLPAGRRHRRRRGSAPLYERAFSGHEDEDEGRWRTDGSLAVRSRDPEGRADEAGRVIPHELVLDGAGADGIISTADVVRQVWPLLAERYGSLWDGPAPD